MKMKKVLSAFLCIVMLFSIATTAGATAVMPRYQSIISASCALTISSSGKADAAVKVTAQSSDSLSGTIELKRFTGGAWETVKTWTPTATRSLIGTFSRYVVSGYMYKVFASVDVYASDGTFIESIDMESNYVLY